MWRIFNYKDVYSHYNQVQVQILRSNKGFLGSRILEF